MAKDKLKGVAKAHTVYKTSDGKRVPGATTITGLLNKPHLIKWANNLGLDGIDSSKYTDEAAAVGTLAHALIQAHLQGEELDMSTFSPVQVDLAENSVISFYEWASRHTIEPIICALHLELSRDSVAVNDLNLVTDVPFFHFDFLQSVFIIEEFEELFDDED